MTSRRAKLQEDTNFRLMQLLHDNPHMSQREMAKALGISFGGINYCLNALIEKGLVKIHNFSQNDIRTTFIGFDEMARGLVTVLGPLAKCDWVRPASSYG